jgi:hypothetical protein
VAPAAGRVLAGWALVAGGALALSAALAASAAGGSRTDTGFTASLTPVHAEGHAILVPDVGAMLKRHGLARLLGDGRLTVTVRSASTDLAAALVPRAEALQYLTGTAHTEVLAVGYASGAQPVQAVDRPGAPLGGPAPWELASGPVGSRAATLSLDIPTTEPVALVVRRSDGAVDLTVSITVGFAPASWGLATAVLWIGASLATLAGLALLLLRRPPVLIPDDLADLDELMAPTRSVSPYVYTAT